MAKLCFPYHLSSIECQQLSALNVSQKIVEKGELILAQNTPLTEVFAIRAGSFKAYKHYQDGEQYIAGFYYPGDLLGIEALYQNRHSLNCVALETSAVCSINVEQLLKVSSKIVSLQKHLLEILAEKLTMQYMINPKSNVMARMASLLLSISSSHNRRGFSPKQFQLSMPRKDIAQYLGIANETVSRTLTQLNRQMIVKVDHKAVTLLDIDKLRRLAE